MSVQGVFGSNAFIPMAYKAIFCRGSMRNARLHEQPLPRDTCDTPLFFCGVPFCMGGVLKKGRDAGTPHPDYIILLILD